MAHPGPGFHAARRLWLTAVACIVFVALAGAQDVHLTPSKAGPTVDQSTPETSLAGRVKPMVMNVDLVLVPVTVTDPKNRPVLDLPKENFTLYEDEQPQTIQYFSHEDTPISIGVLLDTSKSMNNKIDRAREAVQQFFGEANPQDDYFVVTFSDRPALAADTTQSLASIQSSLAQAVPAGRTALLDAIYMGMAKARKSKYQRRALLIISDGGDNASRYSAREIRTLVEEADVQIYAIGIFDSIFRTPEEWHGKKLLTQITEATGGRTATLSNVAELPKIAAAISRELRSQYVLGYRPSAATRNGKWRKIRVRLKTPTSEALQALQVYSKRGYQAPGE